MIVRRNSRHALADDERVDIMRALVSFYRFEIHHVAHDRIIVGNAVAAENVTREARAFKRHPDIVAFGHGDVLEADFAFIFHSPYLE